MRKKRCHYPRSNPLKDTIQATLKGIVTNKRKASKFYLDTLLSRRNMTNDGWPCTNGSPAPNFNNLGTVFAGLPNKGPACVFLDLGF